MGDAEQNGTINGIDVSMVVDHVDWEDVEG